MRRLREHDLVVLSLPDDRMLGAALSHFHVVAMFGSVAALHPVEPAVLERLPDVVGGAYISFRYDGHLVALRGTLHHRSGQIRFKVSDGVTLPRRSSTRVELVAPATVRRRDGSTAGGMTIDIALDGVLVECDPALKAGEQVLLSIDLPSREAPVEAAARVVRTAGDQAGVAFSSIDQAARRHLAGIIFDRSLAELDRRLVAASADHDVF